MGGSVLTQLRAWALGGLMIAAGADAQSPTIARVALVIGNAAYSSAPLANPVNDARAISEVLRSQGFTIIEARNADKALMEEAIRQAESALKGKNGIGLLYYAGHGLQLDWRNYMIPVDAKLQSAAEVPQQTIDVQRVIDAFKAAGNRMNIIVLDACRDSPFSASGSGKGLAPLDAPPGTFLAYATAPGNTAEDGAAESTNGLYTQYLLKELSQPAVKIEDLFKRVRLQVRRVSQGRQVPWESTSLEDDFYFSGEAVHNKSDGDKEAGFNAQKADWDRIKDSKNAADFYAFLQKYPTGGLSEQAQWLLDRLNAAKVQSQPERFGEAQNLVATRFRMGDRYDFVDKDGLTGLERNRLSVQVTAVDRNVARYSASFGGNRPGSSTIGGAIITDSVGTYDPPFTVIPGGEYQVGRRWSGRSNVQFWDGTKGWLEYSGHVASRERIEVPAGAFSAYRVDTELLLSDGSRRRVSQWVQPEWGFPAKTIVERRIRSGGAPDILVRELVARRRTE